VFRGERREALKGRGESASTVLQEPATSIVCVGRAKCGTLRGDMEEEDVAGVLAVLERGVLVALREVSLRRGGKLNALVRAGVLLDEPRGVGGVLPVVCSCWPWLVFVCRLERHTAEAVCEYRQKNRILGLAK